MSYKTIKSAKKILVYSVSLWEILFDKIKIDVTTPSTFNSFYDHVRQNNSSRYRCIQRLCLTITGNGNLVCRKL